jgi:hypothetical protein
VKVREVVEDLSREILTIEAQGNKLGAATLLERYAKLTPELSRAFQKLEDVQVTIRAQSARLVKRASFNGKDVSIVTQKLLR